jgi:hypothetical protein
VGRDLDQVALFDVPGTAQPGAAQAAEALPKVWGCGGRQGMTGRVFGWLGIRNGVGFAPGGNRDRWVEPKR